MNDLITFGDLFAGGGGVTTGALSIPSVYVSWALNHDPVAIATHAANHPETKHFNADLRQQSEKDLDPVDILWASLECTNYSNAKGGLPRDADSRTLAWELPRFAKHCDSDYIIIENVREFLAWGPLDARGRPLDREKGQEYWKWREHMREIGWPEVDHRILNAADYGCHTRRERLFIIFAKKGLPIHWKDITHHPEGNNLFGLPKWKPARECIDLSNDGKSIFGRKKPLSDNTLRRIAGGIKKFFPEMVFLMKYYGTCQNGSSIDEPCHAITTKDRHALIKVEKGQFLTKYYSGDYHNQKLDQPYSTITTVDHNAIITVEKKHFIDDHCWNDTKHGVDEPLSAQLTWQTKKLITAEFLSDGSYGTEEKNFPLEKPVNTLTGQQRHQLVTGQVQFISETHNSHGFPEHNNKSIEQPTGAITTHEKHQFITAFFNASGRPETQNQDIKEPLNAITTNNHHALITALENGDIDFDIKMRFLTPEELAKITGFPEGYFTREELNIPKKQQVKMIGNAVPVGLAAAVIEPIVVIYNEERRSAI